MSVSKSSPVFCMQKQEYTYLGRVIKCNRKTAELSIHINTGDPDVLENSTWIFIELEGAPVPFRVESVRPKTMDVYLVLLEDYHDPEIVQRFVDSRVLLKNNDLAPADSDAGFSFQDIIGFEVIDKEFGNVGKIDDIIEGPEQDLIRVLHKGTEVLIPLVDEFFLSLDKQKKEIILDLPEGLIDIYLNES